MRKVFAVMLCGVMLALIVSVPAFAEYWNEGRSGNSWEDAYVIDSFEDFLQMLGRSDEDTGKYLKLTTDLAVKGENRNYGHAFSGHFDGQNHKIRVNLQSSLFLEINTSGVAIRNLQVEGSVHGIDGAGGIAELLNGGIIENCSFTGTVEAGYDSAEASGVLHPSGGVERIAGGIVEYMTNSGTEACIIRNCTFSGTVRAYNDYELIAGGIAGYVYGGVIENCTVKSGSEIAYADINDDGEGYAGGIAGFAADREELTLSGNSWPFQYPEVGNWGSSSNTPDTPETPGQQDTPTTPDTPSTPTQTSSSSSGGCNSGILAGGLAVITLSILLLKKH